MSCFDNIYSHVPEPRDPEAEADARIERHLRASGYYGTDGYIEAIVLDARQAGLDWHATKAQLVEGAHGRAWKLWQRLDGEDRNRALAEELRELRASGATWSSVKSRWAGSRRAAVRVIWDEVA